MISKETEPGMDFAVPQISPKTGTEQLKIWSSKRWQNESIKRVAKDIIKNAQEMVGDKESIAWESVFETIKVVCFGTIRGEAMIARKYARTIGAIGVALGCSMHDPQLVYLSGECLSDSMKGNSILDGFRETMVKITDGYGLKTLPEPDLYIPILQYFFAIRGTNVSNIRTRVGASIKRGDIEEAYSLISARGDFESTLR